MNTENTLVNPKALVVVFDNIESAAQAVTQLLKSGIAKDKIELVEHNLASEAPQVETPKVHPTTESDLLDGATKWGGAGAGVGLLTGLLVPFPGMALGMAIMGGVTGAIMGGMAGVDHAANVESVDLPTLDEYRKLVSEGNKLVVVIGTHDEVMAAEECVKQSLKVRSHIHPVHGHTFHEHPANKSRRS